MASCPRVDFTCHTHEVRTRTITLPQALLAEVASVTPDPPSRPWEFVPFAPVTGGIRPWRNITRYIDGLLADPAAVAAPLVLGSAVRLLAATALAVFPNTLVTEPPARDRRDARPATVRRAVDFIEANADIDIIAADIARAAGVTSAPSSSPSGATSTSPRRATCAGSASTRPTVSSRRPTRTAIPSRRWLTGGASAARAGSPPTTAGPTASRPARPCAIDELRFVY